MLPRRDPLQGKNMHAESEGIEKDVPSKRKLQERRDSNTHIRKIDFNTKDKKKDKKEHYIMMKEPIQDDSTLINIHAYRCTLNI